jgi:small GTP-binding protein
MKLNQDASAVRKTFKILVLGEMGTGKSSIIRQYVQGVLTGFYKPSQGLDFATKDLEWGSNLTISLQLWDIAGQERYGNMTHVYYQEAVGCLIVFDVTNLQSLDMVKKWKKDVDSKVFTSENQPIPCLLLGNKIDQCQDGKWARSKKVWMHIAKRTDLLGFMKRVTRSEQILKKLISFL